MRIGVLALQGAFTEHEKMLRQIGVECFQIRQLSDLDGGIDGLVLPGGESTVMSRLLRDLGLYEPLKNAILDGMPVLATCAGAILLAQEVDGGVPCFATVPMKVKRNAYGMQLGSFVCEAEVEGIGIYPMRFIRAPYIAEASEKVRTLAEVDEKIVAAEYGSQTVLSFHPELTEDKRIHEYFAKRVQAFCSR